MHMNHVFVTRGITLYDILCHANISISDLLYIPLRKILQTSGQKCTNIGLFALALNHISCLALLDFFRICLPNLNRTKGIGMNAMERNASVDEAHATPR